MLLKELSDLQVATAFANTNADPQTVRQQAAMTPRQRAQATAATIQADRESDDPLKKRIAALRAQLAQLLMQDQQRQKTKSTVQANGGTPPQAPGTQPTSALPPGAGT